MKTAKAFLKPQDFLTLGKLSARCAHEKNANDIRLLDVSGQSGVADYFLLASVQSSPQLRALQKEIEIQIKQAKGLNPLHRDGQSGGQWLVMDYGGLVVHLMYEETREFYSLERLWEDAKDVKWATTKKKAIKKAVKKELKKKPKKKTILKKKTSVKKAKKKAARPSPKKRLKKK